MVFLKVDLGGYDLISRSVL